jgi:hypothetical protein
MGKIIKIVITAKRNSEGVTVDYRCNTFWFQNHVIVQNSADLRHAQSEMSKQHKKRS